MRSQPKILIASDLTARGDRPFDRAVLLAREGRGSAVLLHVVDDAERGATSLDEIRARAIAQLPPVDVPLEVIVTTGSPPARVAEMAAELRADLIVVGAARCNDIRDFFLGTAVDYLVRCSAIPVLVVKRRPFGAYRNVLIATDFSRCSAHAIAAVATMLPHASLSLLHAFMASYPSLLERREAISFAQDRVREDMDKFLASEDVAPFRSRLQAHSEEGAALAVVDGHIRRAGIDLLALGTHGSSGFRLALMGSQASVILAEASCDVLMVREAPPAGA